MLAGAATALMSESYCYMLRCSDGTLYTGWTTNPGRRLREHNSGSASRYTRIRRPVRLVYLEAQGSRRQAMRRERAIKNMSRRRKEDLIRDQPTTLDEYLDREGQDGITGED
jgi:putative endonuclease